MTILILNVGLFLCLVAAGAFAASVGWEISGDDGERRSGRGDGGAGVGPGPPLAGLPGGPLVDAGPDDLACSA